MARRLTTQELTIGFLTLTETVGGLRGDVGDLRGEVGELRSLVVDLHRAIVDLQGVVEAHVGL